MSTSISLPSGSRNPLRVILVKAEFGKLVTLDEVRASKNPLPGL